MLSASTHRCRKAWKLGAVLLYCVSKLLVDHYETEKMKCIKLCSKTTRIWSASSISVGSHQSLAKSPLRLTEALRAADESNQKSWKYCCAPCRHHRVYSVCVFVWLSESSALNLLSSRNVTHREKRKKGGRERWRSAERQCHHCPVIN